MKTTLLPLIASVIFATSALSVYSQSRPVIRDSIYSDILKEQRSIKVLLPPEYKTNTDQTFEVLYVLDGEWYTEQVPFIYNFVASSGYAPPVIFVVLPNTYVDGRNLRDRDFSPTKMDAWTGGADNFHSFLKNELIPYIQQKYRTNGQRSLVGSSFSGLFAVYAFVKEPSLFNAFVASDPNLNWDNHYVPKLAAKKLPSYEGVRSSLFIAGLTRTFGAMGIAQMDSVLQKHAPRSIPWKCIPYENETHYSVQHKAFYDGFRFSHLGYTKAPLEFHPMNGILKEGQPLRLLILSDLQGAHYTTDGSDPTANSPDFTRENVVLKGPGHLKIRSFPNREGYAQASEGIFSAGPLPVSKVPKSAKPGFTYKVYEGDWHKLPPFGKLKPTQSGNVTEGFDINSIKVQKNAAYLLEGFFEVPEDGYSVFFAHAENGARAMLGDLVLFEFDGAHQKGKSFVVPLRKGLYPLRIEFFKLQNAGPVHFMIARTNSSNDRWWQSERFTLSGND